MRRRPPVRSPVAPRDLCLAHFRSRSHLGQGCRLADSFLRNEQRYNVGYGQNEGSSITRVMPPPPSQESLWPLTCISNISRTSIMTEVHSSLPMRGDALVRISVDSGPHPQYIADFNYNGGTFELTHEGDALI
jgi:hypothetical protein